MSAWIGGGGVIMQGGAVTLCDRCPCCSCDTLPATLYLVVYVGSLAGSRQVVTLSKTASTGGGVDRNWEGDGLSPNGLPVRWQWTCVQAFPGPLVGADPPMNSVVCYSCEGGPGQCQGANGTDCTDTVASGGYSSDTPCYPGGYNLFWSVMMTNPGP